MQYVSLRKNPHLPPQCEGWLKTRAPRQHKIVRETVCGFRIAGPIGPGLHTAATALDNCGMRPVRLCCPAIPGVELLTILSIVVAGHETKIDRPATDFLEICSPIFMRLGDAQRYESIGIRVVASSEVPRFMAVLFGEPTVGARMDTLRARAERGGPKGRAAARRLAQMGVLL